MREQRTAEAGPDGAADLLEQLANEISLREWTIRDVVHERCALADLDEELERALGSWLGYCDFAVFRRRFPSLWGRDRESRWQSSIDAPEGRFSASGSPLAGVCRSPDRDIGQCVRASRKLRSDTSDRRAQSPSRDKAGATRTAIPAKTSPSRAGVVPGVAAVWIPDRRRSSVRCRPPMRLAIELPIALHADRDCPWRHDDAEYEGTPRLAARLAVHGLAFLSVATGSTHGGRG